MAHGTPDWGLTAGVTTTYQLTDIGELAVRLGSPISHDRRGDVIWWDDFEWSLNKWLVILGGGDASAVVSTARARNGRYSAHLTTDAAVLNLVYLRKRLPYPILSAMGLEASFSIASAFGSFVITMYVYTGSQRIDMAFKYLYTGGLVQVFDAVSGYVTVAAGVTLLSDPSLFHTVKLVGDPQALKYLRLILDSKSYDVAGLSPSSNGDVTVANMRTALELNGRTGFNDSIYVDDVIVTQNEPA